MGYIEGWRVAEGHRPRGVGRKLLAKAEDWARSHKCVEMASDALIDNDISQRAHEAFKKEHQSTRFEYANIRPPV